MVYQSATEVRANFSEVMDKAVYDRPQFIRRTRNNAVLMGCEMIVDLLQSVMLHCEIEKEDDGSFVMTCNEIEHLIASGDSEDAAKNDMAAQLFEYANDYYSEYGFYVRGANTKDHLPYVMKAMILGSARGVEDMIVCQAGKN